MNKVTIFIIILFWVISALLKLTQKRGARKAETGALDGAREDHRSPSRNQEHILQPFQKPDVPSIRLEDLGVSSPRSPQMPGPSADSFKKQAADLASILRKSKESKPPPTLQDLFSRTVSPRTLKAPPVAPVKKEAETIPQTSNIAPVFQKSSLRKSPVTFMESLNPWQKSVILHEILSPPKSLRGKDRSRHHIF